MCWDLGGLISRGGATVPLALLLISEVDRVNFCSNGIFWT